MCLSKPKTPELKSVLREAPADQVAAEQDDERRRRIAQGGTAATILTSPLGLPGGGGVKAKLGQ